MRVCACVHASWCCSQIDFRLSVLIRIMTVGPGRCPNLVRGMIGGGRGSDRSDKKCPSGADAGGGNDWNQISHTQTEE